MSREFFVFGINHRTAPLQVREVFALTAAQQESLLLSLQSRGWVEEGVVLSTCNRLEIYGAGHYIPSPEDLLFALQQGTGRELPQQREYFYWHQGKEALLHLFRVASSLDSQIVGETHILGQVKEGYERSCGLGLAGKWIHGFFQKAFQVAKKVRNETFITTLPVSVGSCAVTLTGRVFGDLKDKRVLIVGAGEISSTVARHFAKHGVGITLCNRTRRRAEALAQQVGAAVSDRDGWVQQLPETDIVVFATRSEQFLLKEPEAARQAKRRKFRPLLVLDLGVPRNVDPRVSSVDCFILRDLDMVQGIVDVHYAMRLQEAEKAQKILEHSAAATWLKISAPPRRPRGEDLSSRSVLREDSLPVGPRS